MLGNPANRHRAVPLTYEQFRFANASFKKKQRNTGGTEIVEMPNRGHSLTVDNGWREVADTALRFVRRFAPAS